MSRRRTVFPSTDAVTLLSDRFRKFVLKTPIEMRGKIEKYSINICLSILSALSKTRAMFSLYLRLLKLTQHDYARR